MEDIIKSYLNSVVDTSGYTEREYKSDNVEITFRYNIRIESLTISHFYISENNRRSNLGTDIYNYVLDFAIKSEMVSIFRFQIAKNESSINWLNNMGEEYTEANMGGVGKILEINRHV